jgi:hypothetical protein
MSGWPAARPTHVPGCPGRYQGSAGDYPTLCQRLREPVSRYNMSSLNLFLALASASGPFTQPHREATGHACVREKSSCRVLARSLRLCAAVAVTAFIFGDFFITHLGPKLPKIQRLEICPYSRRLGPSRIGRESTTWKRGGVATHSRGRFALTQSHSP